MGDFIKAQSGVEMMVFVSILMIVFTVFLMVAYSKKEDIDREVGIYSAKQVADVAASQVNSALSVGKGYSSKFILPFALQNGISYRMTFAKEDQRVEITDPSDPTNILAFSPILTSVIECTGDNPFPPAPTECEYDVHESFYLTVEYDGTKVTIDHS